MVQVASEWILCKSYVTSLVIGCTKIFQLEDLSKSVKVKKSDEDIKYLEGLYQPHFVMGFLYKWQTNPYTKKK